jgi:signal peptidase II
MQQLRSVFVMICVSVVLIGCDQATKKLAKIHLIGKAPISYLQNTVRLVYVENTGAFLSMGDDWSSTTSFWVFTVFPLVILTGLFVVIIKKRTKLSLKELVALLLIFSGGIGNLIDRILYDRHVTDFLNVGIGSLRTGIFNVADMYVTAGAIMMLLTTFKKRSSAINQPPA